MIVAKINDKIVGRGEHFVCKPDTFKIASDSQIVGLFQIFIFE
jgi:hypothetical protein